VRHPRAHLDELLLHPVRFSILALLHHVAKADFAAVRDAVEVSDSLLSKQIASLEEAGYLAVEKGFVGKRPNTKLMLTDRGRAVFAAHLQALHAIVQTGPPEAAARASKRAT
jgi:DNA-binding MarR family transcriptional regulator